MPGQYATITLTGPGATRDLALPGRVPVAELLPQLLGTEPAIRSGEPESGWVLTTVDGDRLDGTATLEANGVGDGQVLHLHDATLDLVPAPVEDLRDAVEDRVDAADGVWEAGVGRLYAISLAAVVTAAAGFLPGSPIAVYLTGGLICLLAVVMAWWSSSAHPTLTHLALLGGGLWSWRVGQLATASIVPEGVAEQPSRHLYGLVAAGVLAVVILIGARQALPYVVGIGVVVVLGGAATVGLVAGVPVPTVLAVVLLAALFGIGVLPRAGLAVGGLFGLDRRVQAGAELTDAALGHRMTTVDMLLTGGLTALSILAGAASVALSAQAGGYERLLGAVGALVVLTRSRVFERVRHVAALRLAATAAATVAAWFWLIDQPDLVPWLPTLAVLVGLSAVWVTHVDRSTVATARIRQLVGIAEILLLTAAVGLAGQVCGLYAFVTELTH